MGETSVIVGGSFDDLRSAQVRLLEEAAKLGPLHVQLWSDDMVRRLEGRDPKFPEAERQYLLGAIRYVDRVTLCRDLMDRDSLGAGTLRAAVADGTRSVPAAWVVDEAGDNEAKRAFCCANGLQYRVLRQQDLLGLPDCSRSVARRVAPATGDRDRLLRLVPLRPRPVLRGGFRTGRRHVIVGHDANPDSSRAKDIRCSQNSSGGISSSRSAT